jgi:hypothetical protein
MLVTDEDIDQLVKAMDRGRDAWIHGNMESEAPEDGDSRFDSAMPEPHWCRTDSPWGCLQPTVVPSRSGVAWLWRASPKCLIR